MSWHFLSVVFGVCCLWLLQGYPEALEFDRQRILEGQVWRLWTAHFVHFNGTHFAQNVAAAVILYWVLYSKVKPAEWALCLLALPILIGTALLIFYPNLDWYNGLSGLLHAFCAYSFLKMALLGERAGWAAFGIVWAKVIFEALGGPSVSSISIGDMTVITEAHLLGSLSGTLMALLLCLVWRRKHEPKPSIAVLTFSNTKLGE